MRRPKVAKDERLKMTSETHSLRNKKRNVLLIFEKERLTHREVKT